MKGFFSHPAALACLLLLCCADTALSDWIQPLKDLINRSTDQAMQQKENPPATAKPQQSRFKDNGDGTLTDSSTGLIWLKNASCGIFFEGDRNGGRNTRSWSDARIAAGKLADGFCGLKDGSKAGDWRLPDREGLIAIAQDISKKEPWPAGAAFSGLQPGYYWSSTKGDLYPDYAFYVSLSYGIDSYAFQMNSFNVLPVRGHQKAQPQQ